MNIIVYDFETGGMDPTRTQPIQIGAIAIDLKKLEPVPDSEFQSLIKPVVDPEELTKLNLDAVEEKALEKNKKKMEDLLKAPMAKVVFDSFMEYTKKYRIGKSNWGYPIRAGYNIFGFDDIILQRYVGDLDSLFHPSDNIDCMKYAWAWFEPMSRIENFSLSLDSLRKFFGMPNANAHDALEDCYDTGELLIRFLRLHRALLNSGKIKFANTCNERFCKRESFSKSNT